MEFHQDSQLVKAKLEQPVAESVGRFKGVTILKPIVYGNISRYFGKKRDEDGHTHQWTVFVKPYKNEDMSTYVKKIHFKLHESYANSNRVVTKPPYEVTETGWGEFEVVIKIYFHDSNERPVTVYHLLKLFQTESNLALGKKTLVVEHYDEIVFQEPSATMHQLLINSRAWSMGPYKHETDFEEKKEATLSILTTGRSKIRGEIQELNDQLKKCREMAFRFQADIKALEAQPAAEVEASHQPPATPASIHPAMPMSATQ